MDKDCTCELRGETFIPRWDGWLYRDARADMAQRAKLTMFSDTAEVNSTQDRCGSKTRDGHKVLAFLPI